MRQIVGVLGGLFTGKVSVRELQGVVGIARESGRAAKRGKLDLVLLMAVISLNLGLLNLLPIPILDGGHVLLLAIEAVMRRDLSIAVKERFVQVGLVFLLGIFAFVMYSDILKLIQSH
jgi:regulator of sigma E protease